MTIFFLAAALLQPWSSIFASAENDIPFSSLAPGRMRRMPIADTPNMFGLVPEKRDTARFCGTWTFDCTKAAGACNNACYYINCIQGKPGMRFAYDSQNTNDKNRQESGCQGGSQSVCNALPFSQRLNDPQKNANPENTYNCDEFPMASYKQDDFDPKVYRNALRCIVDKENDSGGGQFQAFVDGTGSSNPKRSCTDKLKDNDQFDIEFINVDSKKSPYCSAKIGEDSCLNDGYQFHLVDKFKSAGQLSFPYKADKEDNQYQIDGVNFANGNVKQLLQCRVDVQREGDAKFTAQVFDETFDKAGEASTDNIPKEGLRVKGLALDLMIFRENNGKIGTLVNFNYGANDLFHFNPFNGDFAWGTDSKGVSTQFRSDGSYCKVDAVNNNKQNIQCYFPCYEKDDTTPQPKLTPAPTLSAIPSTTTTPPTTTTQNAPPPPKCSQELKLKGKEIRVVASASFALQISRHPPEAPLPNAPAPVSAEEALHGDTTGDNSGSIIYNAHTSRGTVNRSFGVTLFSRMLLRCVRRYVGLNTLKNYLSVSPARLVFRHSKIISTKLRQGQSRLSSERAYSQASSKRSQARTSDELVHNVPASHTIRTFLFYLVPWIPIYIVWREHITAILSVTGTSMYPLLNGEHKSDKPNRDDKILVNLLYPHDGLQRGMVVVFRSPHDPERFATKRIVALAGDAITPNSNNYPGGKREIIIPYNYMWVEGDTKKRKDNLDSNTYGPISQSLVVGNTIAVVWPFSRISRISWENWEGCDRLREEVVVMRHPDEEVEEKARELWKTRSEAQLAEVKEALKPPR